MDDPSHVSGPVSVDDYERRASELLPGPIFDFVAGGAGRELTLRANVEAFSQVELQPRQMVGSAQPTVASEFFGYDLAAPILVAPTAMHTYLNPAGELATARAASRAGSLMVVSSGSGIPIDEVSNATGESAWLQLYHHSRDWTEWLVRKAEDAGFRGLCLTVDCPVPAVRYRDLRTGFTPELGVAAEAYLAREADDRGTPVDDPASFFDRCLARYEDLQWLTDLTDLPVAVKGIGRGEDAVACLEHGAAAVIVSNHGGRALDGQTATLAALPEVVEAVGDRAPILMDGGIRSGADAVKALALGASAVLVGRPVLWGLAVNGEAGVRQVLELLRHELVTSLALCGVSTISELSKDLLAHPTHTELF